MILLSIFIKNDKKANNWYYLYMKTVFKKINKKNTFKIIKNIFSILLLLIILFFIISIIIYFYISNYSKKYIYNNIDLIPKNKTGLVLGTSPVTSSGETSLFFITRLQATKDLLEKGKIEYIIVSGDNKSVSYNEPKYMRNYLLKIDVNDNAIVQDYGGRRTLDSVLRSNEVFNQNKITIISQKFHNERAIFIARKNGIQAVAYNAKYPYQKYEDNIYINTKTFLRELLARDLAVYDILINKKPAILGNSIDIENENIEGIKRLIMEN